MLGKRILVIGSPGGGKSTFSRRLGELSGLPVVHLDQLNWNSDRTNVAQEVFDQRLEKALAEDSWIMDGNYQRTMEQRLERCHTVFFLDYPVEVCLEGVRSRFGKPRPDIPWVETEEDPEFLEFIREFPEKSRPAIVESWKKYPRKHWVVFRSRGEAEAYLRGYGEAVRKRKKEVVKTSESFPNL